MKEDQATAVIGGKVVSRLARAPLEIRSAMFGRLPPSISGSSTLKEAPSSPITSSLSLIHSIEPRYDYTLRRLLVSTRSCGYCRSFPCKASDQERHEYALHWDSGLKVSSVAGFASLREPGFSKCTLRVCAKTQRSVKAC